MSRVLVVDDEDQISTALAINLRTRGYEVSVAKTGEEALRAAANDTPDLILLDLGLPGIDGLDVIRGLRGWTAMPIIVLSVRESERDKVLALELGADDYLTKPFGMNELIARVRAALRRSTNEAESPVIDTKAFQVDLMATSVQKSDGQAVHLTPTEWKLVDKLVRNPGKLVTQVQLLHHVWGPQFESEANYLRVHMAAIRKKLEPDPARPRYFITDAGLGYRFVPDSE